MGFDRDSAWRAGGMKDWGCWIDAGLRRQDWIGVHCEVA